MARSNRVTSASASGPARMDTALAEVAMAMAAAAAADTVAAATVATIGGATRVRTIADERGIERGTGIVIVIGAARSAGRTMIGAIADATTIMTAGVMTTTGGVN